MFTMLCMSYALADMSKVTILRLCVLFAIVVTVSAQDKRPNPTGNGITAAAVLEKNLVATGGLEAHQRLQSMVLLGELDRSKPSSSGSISFFYQAPSSNVVQLRIDGFGTFWAGRHGSKPISRGTPEPLEEMMMDHPKVVMSSGTAFLAEPLNIWAIEGDLLGLLEWHFRDDVKVELLGRTEVDGRCALALRFTPPKGYRVMRFYDCETFLLVRMDRVERVKQTRDGPQTEQIVRSYFTDYKESFGLKLPRVIRISRPQGESELKLSNIEANVKIDDSVFQ
jgi:hypothetical protein